MKIVVLEFELKKVKKKYVVIVTILGVLSGSPRSGRGVDKKIDSACFLKVMRDSFFLLLLPLLLLLLLHVSKCLLTFSSSSLPFSALLKSWNSPQAKYCLLGYLSPSGSKFFFAATGFYKVPGLTQRNRIQTNI
jgi:hypothetical protein